MKRILATVLLLALLLAPIANARDIVSHTFASIVRVETPDEDTGNPTICTGFMVAPRRALTAAHCVPEDDVNFTVDGKDALVLKRDGHFALVSAGDKPALRFADKLHFRDEVTSFGFAWGEMQVFTRHVSGFKGGDFATDGPLAPGMSGGPVVNQAGDVVGINQAANSVIGIMCGAGELQAFLSASPR